MKCVTMLRKKTDIKIYKFRNIYIYIYAAAATAVCVCVPGQISISVSLDMFRVFLFPLYLYLRIRSNSISLSLSIYLGLSICPSRRVGISDTFYFFSVIFLLTHTQAVWYTCEEQRTRTLNISTFKLIT